MITVQGIGKQYRLGGAAGIDPRDSLMNNIRAVLRGRGKPFWAIRNIDFTVNEGEVFGVIGRNGAGKSTLLKVLSRITVPTEGRFVIEGRLSSLLEVGTGFHPDLSGRDNVYLNGTILGMRRAEVKAKFDEIVEFSGVARFIDTPVKRYSSGQKVRLAFAVAAHLEPEVLIIDEVLAVGDMEFQRKSMSKMKDVALSGRTVIFVSHNMGAVNGLCHRCLLLDQGGVEMIGHTSDVTRRYLERSAAAGSSRKDVSQHPHQRDDQARLLYLRWVDADRNTIDEARVTQRFGLEIVHEVRTSDVRPHPVVLICNANGDQIFTTTPGLDSALNYAPGTHTTTVWFPPDLLNVGTIYATVGLVTWLPHQPHQSLENIMSIEVLDDTGSPTFPLANQRLDGIIRPNLRWEVNDQPVE
jgi:lipopolysaccharide transport system ATP-binding protein